MQPTDYLTFNLAVSDASISVFGYSRGIIEIFNVFQDNGFIISSIWTCEVGPSVPQNILGIYGIYPESGKKLMKTVAHLVAEVR